MYNFETVIIFDGITVHHSGCNGDWFFIVAAKKIGNKSVSSGCGPMMDTCGRHDPNEKKFAPLHPPNLPISPSYFHYLPDFYNPRWPLPHPNRSDWLKKPPKPPLVAPTTHLRRPQRRRSMAAVQPIPR